MPRVARASAGGVCYHVLNRGNGGTKIFRTTRDYTDFVELLREETETRNVRLLAYCLLPDHFHMVLWPRKDGDLSYWMQWLLTSHVRRYHSLHGTSGHVWAGRFRAFPIQANEYLLTVLRYIEQNPLRLKELKLRARTMVLVVGRRGNTRRETSPHRSRPGRARAELAQVVADAVDRRGTGPRAAQRGPRHALGRRQVAATDCSETRA